MSSPLASDPTHSEQTPFVPMGAFLKSHTAAPWPPRLPGDESHLTLAENGGHDENGSTGRTHPPAQIRIERVGPAVSRLTIECGCGERHVLELQG